ncbi:MAG: methylene-tetrahydromethanopterin dehydrogenase N-terminal domain-containing protein [Promethearchaeota archaeon]
MQKEDIDVEIKSILGRKSIIELTPIIIKKKDTSDKICYFFDTDDNASPFDINMAYDAGFDIVVPVSRMTADQVPKLVQDAIFSRKPKAPTTFFIGGSNVKEGEKIAKAVKSSLVPPFECPVIIDPRGSHTTASAVVAMTIDIAKNMHNISDLKGKKVVIYGAGPVGRIAAILGAKIGCNMYMVETWDKSNKEAIVNLVKELTKEAGENVIPIKGIFAPNPEKRFDVAQNADVIWSLAAAGIEVLSEDLMKKLNGKKIVIDINLVPPYGVGGIKPKHFNDEIFPGIFGIGALALGKLKASSEGQILKEAANTKGLKIYDFNYAFEVAKNLLSNK